MKNLMKSFLNSSKGALDITTVVVDVVLVSALIPVIKTFIADAQNLTATEILLLSLVTLFIVLALVYSVGTQSGLIKRKH